MVENNVQRKVQFTKIRDVKSPMRANKHDAGTDFFIPNYSEHYVNVLMEKNSFNNLLINVIKDDNGHKQIEISIPEGEQVMIPSGIKVWIFDKGTYLQATNKSGIASKYSLTVGANTIDADYQGEVHINLLNTSGKTVRLYSGQKVVQFIHKRYIDTEWEEISNEDYNLIEPTDRGEGGFGSTKEY